ncbi:MAG: DUF1330 domain-containing protein [Saprospiraceae bacterium]
MSQEVYIIAQIGVKDYDTYLEKYGMPFFEVFKKFEGTVVAANKEAELLEGETLGNWTVLLKFLSKETALDFINSEEYAPLKDLRINELTTSNQIILLSTKIGL